MKQNIQSFQKGKTYIAYNPDLVENLNGQEGTFEAICNGQVFNVTCEDVPGHSPMLSSLVPAGTKQVWLITRQEATHVESSDEQSRATYAGRG